MLGTAVFEGITMYNESALPPTWRKRTGCCRRSSTPNPFRTLSAWPPSRSAIQSSRRARPSRWSSLTTSSRCWVPLVSRASPCVMTRAPLVPEADSLGRCAHYLGRCAHHHDGRVLYQDRTHQSKPQVPANETIMQLSEAT